MAPKWLGRRTVVRVFLVVLFALIAVSLVVGVMTSIFVSKNDQTDLFKTVLLGTAGSSMVLAVLAFALGYVAMWNKAVDWDVADGTSN